MSYQATDDDLPEFFFDPTKKPSAQPPDAQKSAMVGVDLHFPAIEARRKEKQDRSQRKDNRDAVRQLTKQYVRTAKKLQMWDWLRALRDQRVGLNGGEADFCTTMFQKFERWTPYHVKWVTIGQYNWLHYIAAKYLQLPKRGSHTNALSK